MGNKNSRKLVKDIILCLCVMGITVLVLYLVYENIQIMIGSVLLYELSLIFAFSIMQYYLLKNYPKCKEAIKTRYGLLDTINASGLWPEFNEYCLFLNKALCFEEIRIIYALNTVGPGILSNPQLKKIFDEGDFKKFVIESTNINPNVKEELVRQWILSKHPNPGAQSQEEQKTRILSKAQISKAEIINGMISLLCLVGSILLTLFYGVNGIGRILVSCAIITPILFVISFIGRKDAKLSAKYKLDKFNYYVLYFFDEKDAIPEREKKNLDNIIARYKLGID